MYIGTILLMAYLKKIPTTLMLFPLSSLPREKAARVNLHLPTAKLGWAPTCEEDAVTRVCMLTLLTASPAQRVASNTQPLSPHLLSLCSRQKGQNFNDFTVLTRSLLPCYMIGAGTNVSFCLTWRIENVFWWTQHFSCMFSGRRCTLLCLHLLTATRF